MRLDNLSAFLVCGADHRAFENRLIRKKRGFHLQSGNVLAGRDDHVVGAGDEVETAILVLPETVTRKLPTVADLGCLPGIVDVAATGGAAHHQPSDLAEPGARASILCRRRREGFRRRCSAPADGRDQALFSPMRA
jgi:hypothetical protein